MVDRLRIGTRGSPLALAQAALVRNAFQRAYPDIHCEIQVIRTTGDKDRVRSLVSLGGQGVFVKELENALLDGGIDVAVHSLKDVPTAMASGLSLAGFLPRENPQDALISGTQGGWRELPCDATVGTGSPRRVLQLKALRPDVRCVDIRGNLESRLQKVASGELDAILLGCAGLNRLGWSERISYVFSPAEMVPAVAQGIVGLQIVASRQDMQTMVQAISDVHASLGAQVERGVMAALGGGCRVPMAALCELHAANSCRLHLYLGNPRDGRGLYRYLDLSRSAALAQEWLPWLGRVAQECRDVGIPLPSEVDEHALMEFWGQPEKLA